MSTLTWITEKDLDKKRGDEFRWKKNVEKMRNVSGHQGENEQK